MNAKNTSWPEVRIGQVLSFTEELTKLGDLQEYITITVKRRHGGLEPRERLFGHQIKTKKQYRLIPGAFLISRIQCWHQAYAMVPEDIPQNMIASQNYDQFIISTDVDPRFFWWFSHSPLFTETVRSSAFGVVIEKMVFNRDAWLEKTIPLPPLEEQRRIVSRIDELWAKVTEAKELRRQAVSEIQALPTALVSQLVGTEQVSGQLGEVLLGKPRNGWSARCNNEEAGVAVLSLGAVTGFEYRPGEYKRTSEPTSPHAHYWLKKDELLITRSNTSKLVGHAAIYDGSPSPCIYPDLMMRLVVNESLADSRFVHRWLMSRPAREYIETKAKGTSPTMKKISQGIVMSIPFPTALDVSEQRRIVAYFDALQTKVNSLKKLQSETATELDALMPSILSHAFSGEL